MNELNWTEEQNKTVHDLIAEEIEKARLSHKFIPELKLSDDARSVSTDKFKKGAAGAPDTVDDVSTIALVEVTAPVTLTKLQAEDADLSSALLLIRRASNKLARTHDAITFTGQPAVDRLPAKAAGLGLSASGGFANPGVFETANQVDVDPAKGKTIGEALVGAVAQALITLEDSGYIGSYVLVLGQKLFTEANTPSKGSMVLPMDRIEGLLGGGSAHRSSVLDDDKGVLLSLGGEPLDRAVAVSPKFEFLRIEGSDKRACRVFERFSLRLKEKDSVVKLILI
jgi:hypothetical protein